MGNITNTINGAFRDFETDGVSSSGAHEVVKSDVRAVGPLIESAIANAALGALVDVIYATRAELDADLAHAADSVALVYADATDANNDLYVKVGASGAGSWTLTDAIHTLVAGIAQPYVDDAEAAAALAEANSLGALLRLIKSTQIFGYDIDPMPDAASAVSASYFVFGLPIISDSILTEASFNARATGTVTIGVWDKSGNNFTLARSTAITVSGTGAQSHAITLKADAGQYVGFIGTGIVEFETGTPDNGGWFAGATPDFTDASSSASARLFIRIEASRLDRIDQIETFMDENSEARTAIIGKSGTLITTANVTSAGVHFVLATPCPASGTLTEVELYCSAAHDILIGVYSRSGDTFTLVDQRQYDVAGSGLQSLPLDMPIEAGQHIGFISPNVNFQTSTLDTAAAWYSGVGDSFVDASITTTTPLQFRGTISYRTASASGGSGRPSSVDLPFTKGLVIGAGQSLMEGSTTPTNGVAPITTTQDADNSVFPAYPGVPGDLLPATVANSQRATDRGEWSGLGMMIRLRDLLEEENNLTHEDLENTLVAINTAVGGQLITALAKGTDPYASGIAAATRLAQIDPAAGALAVCWGQGEQDASVGTASATYLAALKTLAKDYDADLRSATGQTKRVPFITYQVTASTFRRIGLVHLQASLDSELIYLSNPMYPLEYYDSVHINAESERIWGAYQARVIKRVVMDGGDWEPLRPIASRVAGNTVVLTFNKGGLAFDTTLIPAQANHGFELFDEADGAVVITGVEIINGREVRITCGEAIGSGYTVKYGDNSATGRSDAYTGGCGNLRDSAGDTETFDGTPLHNWCVLFDWEI